jgi:hypothetical protein
VLCEGDISDAEACHSHYPSGCSTGQTAKNAYDFTLNVLKNEVKWTSNQPGQFRNSLAEFNTLEAKLPQDLGPRNHDKYRSMLSQAGEGSIQGVVGYLYGAKAEAEESSNCKLPDTPDHANVDFHIYIGFDPDVAAALRKNRDKTGKLTPDEHSMIGAHALHSSSVIVEMTPHYRENFHKEWTIDALAAAVGDQVRVVGQLLVDNEHFRAGQDCALDTSSSACWRATVWEIHPVTDFKVCTKEDGCSQAATADWAELGESSVAPANASTPHKKGKSKSSPSD